MFLNIIFEKYLTKNTVIHEGFFFIMFLDNVTYLSSIFFFHELQSLNPPVLIFVQSKERAKELYKELAFDDVRVDAIHADLNEQQVLLCILLLLLYFRDVGAILFRVAVLLYQVHMFSTYVCFTAASRCC